MAVVFLRMLFVVFAMMGPAFAAGEVHFPTEVADATVAPGGTVPVRITIKVGQGLHTFRDTISVETVSSGKWKVGEPSIPPGVMRPDPGNGGKPREQYEDDVLIDVPVTAPADAAGEQAVAFHVRVQGCKKDLCFFPEEYDVTSLVKVAGVGAVTPPATGGAPTNAGIAVTVVAAGPDSAKFHVDLLDNWHANKAMVWAAVSGESPVKAGEACLPNGRKSGSEAEGTAREDLEEDFDFTVPLSGAAGKTTVKLDVGWQVCKGAELCKMPEQMTFDVPVELTGAALAACPPIAAAPAEKPPVVEAAAAPAAPAATGSAFAAAQSQGVAALVLFCFLGGVAVSFTPCVLPMVPITIGIIGARGAGSRAVAMWLAATYVAGLALVYTGLGVFAGVTGTLFGSWLQSVWLVGAISAFFFVMGASMFGFFDIGVPSFIATRLSGKGGGGSYGGALVVGMIGAIVAGPCSGPVVASILGYIAQASSSADTGAIAFGAMLMFAFSVGMGMIFLVTTASSGWLPSRGPWMVVVKKSFGIVMWLGAIYYISPHLPLAVVALSTAAVLLSTAVFAWPSEEDGEELFLQRFRQLYSVTAALVGAYLLVGTLVREGFILPPVQTASASPTAVATASIRWLPSEKEALERAAKEGKPVMIDFTAEWCAACHEMERFTYTDARVIEAANGFVTVMIDCTEKSDPAIVAIQKKYGVVGLPTVVFVKPDGTKVGETIGFVEADAFLPHMQAAAAAVEG